MDLKSNMQVYPLMELKKAICDRQIVIYLTIHASRLTILTHNSQLTIHNSQNENAHLRGK